MANGAKRALEEIHHIREAIDARYKGLSSEERARLTNEAARQALKERGIKLKVVPSPDSRAA